MTDNDPLFGGGESTAAPLAPRPAPRSGPKPIWLVAGGVILVLAIGLGIWRLASGGSGASDDAPVTLVRDPDPPIAPPPAKELVKPEFPPNVLPSNNLEAILTAIIRSAAQAPEVEEALPAGRAIANRWEVRFPTGVTVDLYARQLDALAIELGIVGGGDTITYVSQFTAKAADKRTAPAAEEQRMYMTWRSGPMRELDIALLTKAEVSVGDRVIAQFYPPSLEQKLAELEREFADKHPLEDVRHTVFDLRQAAQGYEFVVVEQQYGSGEVKTAGKGKGK